MFDSEENAEIILKELSNLSVTSDQVIEGYSKLMPMSLNKHLKSKTILKQRNEISADVRL